MAGYDRLTPAGEQFYRELDQLGKLEVFVGFQEGEEMHDAKGNGLGVDMAQVAAFNELGTSTAPARPFIRQTFDKSQSKIERFVEAEVTRLRSGGTAQKCARRAGVFGKRLIQREIRNGTFEPNAPSTIKSKGSSHPLIDTGQMRQSVNFIVRQKGEK